MSESRTPRGETQETSLTGIASDDFLKRLRDALQKDGDFPASAKVVNELKMLAGEAKTTANQITEVILREPSLGARILHLVNSSFYRRAKPIMTVSQAVIQVGMKPIADLCAGLVLLQKFVPMARKGGPFANCLKKSVVTSLLSSSFSNEIGGSTDGSRTNETGYIAGSFSELGTLLLAYYFPALYEAAVKRSEQKKIELGDSIKSLTGLTPIELSVEVIKALDLPAFYCDVLMAAQSGVTAPANGKVTLDAEKVRIAAQSVGAGTAVSAVVVAGKGKAELDAALKSVKSRLGIELDAIQSVMGGLTDLFKDHCASIELDLPPLPSYLDSYRNEAIADADAPGTPSGQSDQFNNFITEIRQAVENREPTASIITTVMETLAWSLGFERVLLLLVNQGRRRFVGRMMLGQVANFNPTTLERPIEDPGSPQADSAAFNTGSTVFHGDPVFEDGWPFAGIPIGFGKRALGVIYADRVNQEAELTEREKAAVAMLADLLDQSIRGQG